MRPYSHRCRLAAGDFLARVTEASPAMAKFKAVRCETSQLAAAKTLTLLISLADHHRAGRVHHDARSHRVCQSASDHHRGPGTLISNRSQVSSCIVSWHPCASQLREGFKVLERNFHIFDEAMEK